MTPDPREAAQDDPTQRTAWYGHADDETPNPWVEGNLGTNVTAYLLGGPLAFGGIAWLISSFWLHQRWLIGFGVLIGMALSLYVIWLRYGRR